MAVQLLLYLMLPPELVQYCMQNSCVVAVKLFLHTFCRRPCSVSIQQYRYDSCLEKRRFILSVRSDFHMADSLSIAVHAFASRVLMSVLVDEALLPTYVNLSASFGEQPFSVEISPL